MQSSKVFSSITAYWEFIKRLRLAPIAGLIIKKQWKPSQILNCKTDLTSFASFTSIPRQATAWEVFNAIHTRRTVSTRVVIAVINVYKGKRDRGCYKVGQKLQKLYLPKHLIYCFHYNDRQCNEPRKFKNDCLFHPRKNHRRDCKYGTVVYSCWKYGEKTKTFSIQSYQLQGLWEKPTNCSYIPALKFTEVNWV